MQARMNERVEPASLTLPIGAKVLVILGDLLVLTRTTSEIHIRGGFVYGAFVEFKGAFVTRDKIYDLRDRPTVIVTATDPEGEDGE